MQTSHHTIPDDILPEHSLVSLTPISWQVKLKTHLYVGTIMIGSNLSTKSSYDYNTNKTITFILCTSYKLSTSPRGKR